MNTISVAGLVPPSSQDDRTGILLDVTYNDEKFSWSVMIPNNFNGAWHEYLSTVEDKIYQDIENKLQEWEALTPKTRQITVENEDGLPIEITVDIKREEIVKPTYPDYYLLRKREYPALAEQIDCFWKDSETLESMREKILEIKRKYPKT